MHAEIVDRLEKEGQFSPKQAMEIATAIDASVERAQYLTVPVFDARLTVLQADIDKRFAAVGHRFAVLQADIDKRFSEQKAHIDIGLMDLRTELRTRFTTLTAILIVVVFATFANGPLGTAALEALKRLL